VIFEFLRDDGTILGAFDSSDLAPTAAWFNVFQCCEGPPLSTQIVHVRLVSMRRSGKENDGYFDNLEVFPICPLPIEETPWGLFKTMYR
jgi:hypothetical protein